MELPSEFTEEMRKLLSDGEAQSFFESLSAEPSVSIRLNSSITSIEELSELNPEISPDGKVPWSDYGHYLKARPDFTSDPLFHAGCYYVQEASSMFLEQAIRKCANGPVTVLDLCAAPGGKSTHLCSLLPEGSLLIANEINRSRANILVENISKWGYSNTVITNDTPERIGRSSLSFDIILVDAPCSGEGMFRKDPTAISEWSLENVRMCATRQREILSSIWDSLRPGGHLIYSTCTYNTSEDESNVEWLMQEFGAEIIPIDTPSEWKIRGSLNGNETLPVYHFMQHRTRGEGFFLALLKKPGVYSGPSLRKSQLPHNEAGEFTQWVREPERFLFRRAGESIYAMPLTVATTMLQASVELKTMQTGLQTAVLKGRDWAPAHHLAMSDAVNADAFPTVELTLKEAQQYLHLESLRFENVPKGFIIVTYRGIPLGFMKNIGGRANNLYPQNWRIRKSKKELQKIKPFDIVSMKMTKSGGEAGEVRITTRNASKNRK